MANEICDETDLMASQTKIRTLNCELNVLTRPDGSVILSQGSTCVLAAMSGPIEVKLQHLKVNKAYVECVYRPKCGLPTMHDKIRESLIQDACEACLLLEMHPRNKIAIQLQELDNRGGLVACAINAACLSLLIGGAPMKFSIAAVHCALDQNDSLVLDPDELPEKSPHKAHFTFVFDSLERDLVTLYISGSFKMTHFEQAYEMSRSACSNIFGFYRYVITKFHRFCPERRSFEQFRHTSKSMGESSSIVHNDSCGVKTNDISQKIDLEGSENWNPQESWDTVEPAPYDPQNYAAKAGVLRQPVGLKPAERSAFRESERRRLQNLKRN